MSCTSSTRSGPRFSLQDFTRAAEEAKRIGPPPESTVRLTRHEFERLKAACPAQVPSNVPGLPQTFQGVKIEVEPDCWGLSDMCAELHHKCRAAGSCILTPPKLTP